MRFIHTADLHIDQPFSGINSDDVDIKKILKDAKQTILSKIVDVCIEKKVDFLLIVGDTFHRNQPSIHTQKLVFDQFNRLKKAGINVIMSFGNHDYYTANRYWFDWPDNVTLFKKEAVQTKTLHLKNGESVSISGFSYEHMWIEQSMITQFPQKQLDTTYHIGFYHGDSSEKYASFSPNSLPHDYDYWALGHIHKSEIVSENPLTAYPGTPQGHTKKETQTKGILLVELSNAKPKVEWIEVANIKWFFEELILDNAPTRQEILRKVEAFLLAKMYSGDLNVVSLSLKTTSEGAENLLNEKEELLLYLQDSLFKQSHKAVWLKDLQIKTKETEKLIMGFDASLIDDLSRKYQTNQAFERVVSDLTKQPTIANNLSWETSDIIKLLSESSQLIKDKMIFKDGEKR